MIVTLVALALGLSRPPARPPHYTMWLCVHRQEHSAWNDPNPPYWGGLQMGEWFIGHYAHPRGTPDQWTPLQQMWVAENALKREVRERGWSSIPYWLAHQWPPSRGVCF